MEDMKNYAYTLFRTIPSYAPICITLLTNMMQITQQFGALYKLIQHILPSNMC